MKYFVISDIHSFAKEMKAALKQAGYKKTDKDSTLIVCGDIFDRGPGTIDVYKFLKTVPNNRLIIIRGNHEDLLENALKKTFPDYYDFSNGTVHTLCDMSGLGITSDQVYDSFLLGAKPTAKELWAEIVKQVKKSEIYKWFKSATWHDYYELDNYIFVHSFIPVTYKPEFESLTYQNKMKLPEKVFAYDPNWKTGDWDYARWGCPYKLFKQGCFDGELAKGKALVCGHWDTQSFKLFYNISPDYEIYYGDGLIGLDGCTAYTHNCNVLVIKDGICYDKYGNKLEVQPQLTRIETVEVN